MKGGPRKIWRTPVLMAALTLAGLLGALTGDGLVDWISAVGLSVPVGVCVWYGLLKR